MKRRICAFFAAVFLVACLPAGVAASQTGEFVADEAGLLTDGQRSELEEMAGDISRKYDCGIYLLTVADMADYGYDDPFDFAVDYYTEHDLGISGERNGLLLVISIRQRDYALAVYGEDAKAVFTDSALMYVEDAFLPDLGNNDWYAGAYSYLLEAGNRLSIGAEDSGIPDQSRPASGSAHSNRGGGSILVNVILPFGISGAVCGILLASMNSARKKSTASEYVCGGSVKITAREDRYINTTHVRRRVESSDSGHSGSGHSRSSGGFSGRSGKF